MPARLRPQNAEAVLGIVECDALDEARQHFLGRRRHLWFHANGNIVTESLSAKSYTLTRQGSLGAIVSRRFLCLRISSWVNYKNHDVRTVAVHSGFEWTASGAKVEITTRPSTSVCGPASIMTSYSSFARSMPALCQAREGAAKGIAVRNSAARCKVGAALWS
jgi:hypothetical protein